MATYNKLIEEDVNPLTIAAEDKLGESPFPLTVPALTIAFATSIKLEEAVEGAVQNETGVGTTDYTDEANEGTANDVVLLPDPLSVGDGFLVGSSHKFSWALFKIDTPGVGAYTIDWQYWNGSIFTNLNVIYDSTADFKMTGMDDLARIHAVDPGDWKKVSFESRNLYWFFAKVTGAASMTTRPLATQIWVGPPVASRIMGGGNFQSRGKSPKGRIVNVSRYTTTQTLVVANHHVACDTDGGAFTVTLPAGIKGTEYRIGNTGTSGNNLTITPDGTELLVGVNDSFVLTDGEVLHVVYEPTEGWM